MFKNCDTLKEINNFLNIKFLYNKIVWIKVVKDGFCIAKTKV